LPGRRAAQRHRCCGGRVHQVRHRRHLVGDPDRGRDRHGTGQPAPVKVALISEGTYPFAMGGVSVWCDQLIRGLPDYRWDMVAPTVAGGERSVWPSPHNLDRLVSIPLWGGGGGGRRGRPSAAFRSSYEVFLTSLVTPIDPRPERAAVQRSRFLLALRGLYEYA